LLSFSFLFSYYTTGNYYYNVIVLTGLQLDDLLHLLVLIANFLNPLETISIKTTASHRDDGDGPHRSTDGSLLVACQLL